MPRLRPAKPFVAGTGLCASAGADCAQNFKNAKNAADFFKPQKIFDSPKFGEKLCGTVESFSEKHSNPKLSKCAKILFSAIEEALKEAALSPEQKDSCGIFLGTSIGGVFETEEALRRNFEGGEASLEALRYYECSSLADMAAKRFGIGRLRMTFSTACSSSGLAMEAAVHALSEGRVKAAVVCGVDALSRITVNGFGSLLLLSDSKSRPFDKNRDGINLGEAAGAVVLVCKTEKPVAQISGCACTCDAHHATAPHPEGAGIVKAAEEALAAAGIDAGKISWICAHGTGTQGNDVSEFKAFERIWGENMPPYFSLKGVFGHTLGASGILNAVISIKAMNDSALLPSAGFETRDEEISKIPNLKLRSIDAQSVISNSLGFGGNNSAIIISKPGDFDKPQNENLKLCIYSCGLVSPLGNSLEEFSANLGCAKNAVCDTSAILKNMQPLKKRRLARMQQMALEAANQALEGADFEPQKTCVCFATGLGMTEQTAKFLESVLRTKEAEASPTAFTNSVHNAPPSAIANAHKTTGLNSAVTAKELSFECALWQAWSQLKYAESESAVIAAADEKNPLIDAFRNKHSVYSQSCKDTGEGAAAYFAGLERPNEKPKAIVHFVEFEKREKDPELEAKWVGKVLAANGVSCADISGVFVPSTANGFEKRVFERVSEKLNISISDISDSLGISYINSAYFPAAAISKGRGLYLMLTLSSGGSKALTLIEAL